jgi:transmembrane sensor
MKNQRSEALLKKYLAGQCTPEEQAVVESWYYEFSGKQKDNLPEPEYTVIKQETFDAIDIGEQQQQIRTIRLWPRVAAAAILVISLSAGWFFYFHNTPNTEQVTQTDIKPGGNKAILTLSNGKQIVLTDAKKGKLANESNTTINKSANGQVKYTSGAGGSTTTTTVYNTLSTPRGGQYALILSDGTKVVLNAASSIKYPTAFKGNERSVELTGEAYFEVAHNKAKPFLVKTAKQTVQVLGTHFNVNTYTDEAAVKTTLLEGSVRVCAGSSNTLIKPGQQAVLAKNKVKVYAIDVEDVVAWKEGMFRFTDESLESVMRKVSRWYDVDVVYQDEAIKELPFNGIATRFGNVSKILHMIELTKRVHFKIEGRKILVMK